MAASPHQKIESASPQVRSVSIEGFLSFKKLELELRGLNVLIGANGSGKSNFLEFFNMLRYLFWGQTGELPRYVAQNGFADSIFHYGRETTQEIACSLDFDGVGPYSGFNIRLGSSIQADLFVQFEQLIGPAMGSQGENPVLGATFKTHPLIKDYSKQGAGHHLDPNMVMASKEIVAATTSIDRYHFRNTSLESPMRYTPNDRIEPRMSEQGANLAPFLHRIQQEHARDFENIQYAVKLAAPFIDSFQVEPLESEYGSYFIRWTESGNDYHFKSHQMSDGTLRLLALITALLQPEAYMRNLLLFDEPELGLHPRAQHLVAELMQNLSKRRQIIVATQSPVFIRTFKAEDIIVAERESEEQIVDEPANSGQKGWGTSLKRLDPQQLKPWLKKYDLGELYEKNVTGGRPN